MQPAIKAHRTNCCICGGGPAGMMLGFLLARAGVEVIVVEKHKDFFRDFRGDTIHPSTIELIYELGLLEEFLKIPHQEIEQLTISYNSQEFIIADFTHLPVHKKVLALMPQWDFLNFLEKQASRYPQFTLFRETTVTALIKENQRVAGIRAETPQGTVEVRAAITVGCDGRSSTVRELAGLSVIHTGAPIDALWFRLSRKAGDPERTLGRFDHGRLMVLLDRDDYWQCAYVIPKGNFEQVKMRGIEDFRRELSSVSPFISNRRDELKDWDDFKLLSVSIDHLEKWYAEGLLCIGDAAHAMSPVGGVGINLAIQDAVATANALCKPLLCKQPLPLSLLKQIQQRRTLPRKLIQGMQVFVQKKLFSGAGSAGSSQKLPWPFVLLKKFPVLRRIPARFIGMGPRPEHIRTPDVYP